MPNDRSADVPAADAEAPVPVARDSRSPRRDVIVIGTSAGGIETLQQLARVLPPDLPAAIFVVQHVAAQSPGLLPAILSRAGPLPAVGAADGAPIDRGVIYVAAADRHLLLERDRMRVVYGPKENRHRPGIDPLFRSAAWVFGPRVIGVILTGTLDDGAAGLWAVKSVGGVTVVQQPTEALYPDMPLNALRVVDVDHVVPVDEMGALFARLTREPVPAPTTRELPERIRMENDFVKMKGQREEFGRHAKIARFTCPDCQGTLWEWKDGELLRYRCHVGHAFSPETLIAAQSDEVEHALTLALRALEEKAMLARRLAERYGDRVTPTGPTYPEQAQTAEDSAKVLRELLAAGRSREGEGAFPESPGRADRPATRREPEAERRAD